MDHPRPLYTPANCHAAHRLYWSLSVFWLNDRLCIDGHIPPLREALHGDGLRLLQHSSAGNVCEQFFVRATPTRSPSDVIRLTKGRLQYLLRDRMPRAFRRNYRIESVGYVTRARAERYVAAQLRHHGLAGARPVSLAPFQIRQPDIDLSVLRYSGHGQFRHVLHVVLANEGRWANTDIASVESLQHMLLAASRKKGHLLSRAGLCPDHIHMVIGCGVQETPQDVVLGYMNNLAYVYGMRPVLAPGYYAATVGEYDRGALRQPTGEGE